MKQHKGMRPHDVVVLLKIAAKGQEHWQMKDLAEELGISKSEVSESLHRSTPAGLLASDKRTLMRAALLEFLRYGLRYVYPQQPGAMVRGMATAHSAPPLNKQIESNEKYVWPWAKGTLRGQRIEPLYKAVPEACAQDEKLHELLALTDSLRIGKTREVQIAMKELEKRIK